MAAVIIGQSKPIKEILQHLMRVKKLKSGSALAKQLQIPAPTVNRILSGQVRDPRASTLELLADYFGVSIDQLLGKEALQDDDSPKPFLKPSMAIPIVSKFNNTDIQPSADQVKEWFRWSTDNPSKHKDVFAWRVDTDHLEPVFHKGTILVVNPKRKPMHQDYIAVHFGKDTKITIRKLMTDGRDDYFHPIQKGHKVLALDAVEHTMTGVVIEAHTDLIKFR